MFTILVVDDEEMVLGLCKCVLADFSGFHVLSATCGREALKVAGRCGTAVERCYARFRSQVDHTFGEKLLSAMRLGFGGHVETPQLVTR